MRAQETAFQLISATDRGEVIPTFLRRYAKEQERPGRISDAARFRELVETIRREALLVLALQVETDSAKRFGGEKFAKASSTEPSLVKLFRDEFYTALARSLDYSEEEFSEFCRDLDVYRTLRIKPATPQARAKGLTSPKGPFADRCGFLLDSPMLDQGRRAAAQFEFELMALASAILRKVLSRRERF